MTYTRISIGHDGRTVVRGWHTEPATDTPSPVRLPDPPAGFGRDSITLTVKGDEKFIRCRWTDRQRVSPVSQEK